MLPGRGGEAPGRGRGSPWAVGSKKAQTNKVKWSPGKHDLETFGDPWASVGRYLGAKMDSWASFFTCFFRFDFRLVFSLIFNGFEGRKGTIFYSIFEFFAARAILANCEFYLRKTHIFHVWEAWVSKIFKRFWRLIFDVFSGRVPGPFLAGFGMDFRGFGKSGRTKRQQNGWQWRWW